MKKITSCKLCNKLFQMRGGYRYCANVGCTEYNKQFGGNVVRQKNKKEEEE